MFPLDGGRGTRSLFSFVKIRSTLKGLLLPTLSILFAAASAKAAITVQAFDPGGTSDPQLIAPLDTTIGAILALEPNYRAFNSSNTEFKFVRHVYSVEDNICFYWFRADEDPTTFENTEEWSDVYWYVGEAGSPACIFVDGAEDGSNNFVLLHSETLDRVVGVLQYDLNGLYDMNQPARLLAYAVNPEGLTFAEGVAAIQAIPEPSTVALLAMTTFGGIWTARRRTASKRKSV